MDSREGHVTVLHEHNLRRVCPTADRTEEDEEEERKKEKKKQEKDREDEEEEERGADLDID